MFTSWKTWEGGFIKLLFARDAGQGLRLFFICIVSIFLMYLDEHAWCPSSIHTALDLFVTPIRWTVDLPIRSVEVLSNHFLHQKTLAEENARLREDIFQLKAILQQFAQLQHENAELRSLSQVKEKLDQKSIVARIINVQQQPWSYQLVLNRGKSDGVHVGQAVLDAEGVMGQVIARDAYTSRVLLLTDPTSAVPVVDSDTNFRSILVGTGDPEILTLEYVTKTNPLKVGDLLITSGLGGVYPPGYPVAMVTAVQDSQGEQFKQVFARATAHLFQSQQVLLVSNKMPAMNDTQEKTDDRN
jgi:rod shape-determining protein MreC